MYAQRKTGSTNHKLRTPAGKVPGEIAVNTCRNRLIALERDLHVRWKRQRVEGREQRVVGIGSGYEKAASADRGGGEFATRGSSNSWEVN
jgi:hypothetical protein